MDQTLYFRLLLIALFSLSECIQHRYHYVNMNKTWTDAQGYCRENYTDLATVNNMNDMKQLMNSVNNQSVNVWIGLQNTGVHKWKWSMGDPVSYEKNKLSCESSNQKKCAFMKNCENWDHEECKEELNFICYDERQKGFFVETSNKNWTDAQRFCRENHTDLASVSNQTENDQIKNAIKNNNENKFWIGLFCDSWGWSAESDSTFRNWKSTEPNNVDTEECTEANMKHGQWNNLASSESRTFVCHEDKLVLIRENVSWPEALKYCREKHVDLVSVDSWEIQQWVTEVSQKASTAAVWLGLRHSCVVGIWFWVNGEIVCYENWAPGNGITDEDCDPVVRSGAVQSGDHRWVSRPETEKLNFICIRYDKE